MCAYVCVRVRVCVCMRMRVFGLAYPFVSPDVAFKIFQNIADVLKGKNMKSHKNLFVYIRCIGYLSS